MYIADQQEFTEYHGPDANVLKEPFHHASNVWLMFGFLVLVFLLAWAFSRSTSLKKWSKTIAHKAASYYDLIPWMMRLSLGIALIGAGVSGWLISPALPGLPAFSFIEIFTGFMMMAGFMTGIAPILAIIIFIAAISKSFYMLGSLDFLAMSLAILIGDSRRPGLDDLFGIPDIKFQKLRGYIPVILRLGIGFSLVFLAVYEKFFNPDLAAFVVNITHLTNVIHVSPEMWVVSTGLIELTLGLLLVFGLWTRLVAAITFFVLSLSFFYFGESVISHITLFGILSVLFVTGGRKLKHQFRKYA